MTDPVFRYETGEDGQPAAHPIGGAHADLASFLNEEVRWPDYADQLLDSVAKAGTSGKPEINTGNAYAVTVGATHAAIEHLHVKHHKKVRVPVGVFARALREWKGLLEKNTP